MLTGVDEPTLVAGAEASLAADRPGPASSRPAPQKQSLILQAISERDSRPIAIINDQLVMEGDKIGPARVLRIGSESVEVALENGQHETVRFAPPPPPLPPDPSPTPHP